MKMLTPQDNEMFFYNSLAVTRACNQIIGLVDADFSQVETVAEMQKQLDLIRQSLEKMQQTSALLAKAVRQ
jgi:hypothetical protein